MVPGKTYAHEGGKDGAALTTLLRKSGGNLGEIEGRWKYGLSLLLAGDWKGCASLSELDSKWNKLVLWSKARGPAASAMGTEEDFKHGGFER